MVVACPTLRNPDNLGPEQRSTFEFVEAAPDAVRFVTRERRLEAVTSHGTVGAQSLGEKFAFVTFFLAFRNVRRKEQRPFAAATGRGVRPIHWSNRHPLSPGST